MKVATPTTLLPALVLAVALAGSAWAQSATTQMKEAGSSAENAVSHAYHGTATAVDDTALTAKVKTALHDDATTKGSTIHVTTVAGVVTLRGRVASGEISDRAQAIATSTSGVKGVKNKLKIPQS
jgi:hyperosmotically inducible protein